MVSTVNNLLYFEKHHIYCCHHVIVLAFSIWQRRTWLSDVPPSDARPSFIQPPFALQVSSVQCSV
jgi:hypothetical protein